MRRLKGVASGTVAIAVDGGRGAEVWSFFVRARLDVRGRLADPFGGGWPHVPGVAAIESNGRQYCPAANARGEANACRDCFLRHRWHDGKPGC